MTIYEMKDMEVTLDRLTGIVEYCIEKYETEEEALTNLIGHIRFWLPKDDEDYWMRAQDGNKNSDYCRDDSKPGSEPYEKEMNIIRAASERLNELKRQKENK